MNAYRNDILLAASDLGEGDGIYTTCPACDESGKFSITRDDDGILFHCFRASCELHGGGKVGGSRSIRTGPSERKQGFTPFTGELAYLTTEWIDFMAEHLGWREEHFAIGRPMLAVKENRVAYPILNPIGVRRGYSLRSYSNAIPKSLTRMDCAESHISYYKCAAGDPSEIVIVEDIPSAVRAAKYVNAAALCGTGCNRDYAKEIAAHFTRVTWALDADATKQALRLQRDHSLMFESSCVLVLDCDLKNMTEEDLCQLLGSNARKT